MIDEKSKLVQLRNVLKRGRLIKLAYVVGYATAYVSSFTITVIVRYVKCFRHFSNRALFETL